jgi:predicted anti-sigma-YlaC factor YlaD
MNHQPYELWILEAQELDHAQRSELALHLEGCQACRKLKTGWTAARMELYAREMVSPRAGFTNRWTAGIAERRLKEQRKQAWKLFLTCSGTAAALLVFFVAYVLSTTSMVQWIQAGVRVISSTVGLVGAFRDVSTTWMQYSPPALNVAVWISIAITLCTLTFIWVFALWRTSFGRAESK